MFLGRRNLDAASHVEGARVVRKSRPRHRTQLKPFFICEKLETHFDILIQNRTKEIVLGRAVSEWCMVHYRHCQETSEQVCGDNVFSSPTALSKTSYFQNPILEFSN